ncbi:Uncharacterised protein [Vibrio cholerae]|nr:Uncharacterised protein [Vibrio cholerae]CSI55827.1 Uncharacterised protein [Vibrio cholerae]CSI81601.1 Uncharacterised protein [Vibrio cholerae]
MVSGLRHFGRQRFFAVSAKAEHTRDLMAQFELLSNDFAVIPFTRIRAAIRSARDIRFIHFFAQCLVITVSHHW